MRRMRLLEHDAEAKSPICEHSKVIMKFHVARNGAIKNHLSAHA